MIRCDRQKNKTADNLSSRTLTVVYAASTENIDHGKTTLLDKVRGTTVALTEAGHITQAIGATNIPFQTIKKICGKLLDHFKVKITVPGLLMIDSPGHDAFVTLRKRGGAVADIGILVIDINEGFKPQTDESLIFLKQFKTPFVVAATKIDKIPRWYPYPNDSFVETFKNQRQEVKDELDKRLYRIVSQLSERGFNAERVDRIEDFTKQVAVIPTSGISGEGIPDLLMVLTGLAQQFLKKRLEVSNVGRGTVLEVKETVGLGTTVDVILYDGVAKVGNYMVIGGKKPLVTKIKALLRPPSLRELRIEKKFESVDEVSAAAGIKISAPNLEEVIAGSPILIVKSESEVERAKKLVQKEVEEVEFVKQVEGVVLKADTLGGLEALIKLATGQNIPIRKAEVGHVTKQDIIDVQNIEDDLKRAIFAFNVKVLKDAEKMVSDLRIPVFQSNIIYKIIENYKEWCLKKKEREAQEKLERVSRPVKVKLLKGFTFRVSRPCIVGVEVRAGLLKPGILLKRENGKIIDRVKEIQREGKKIEEAKVGDRVAISMEQPTMGRQINEGDVLVSALSDDDLKTLKELYDRLTESERELLKEFT